MAHNSLGNISLPLIGNPYVFFVKASSASDVICSSQFKHLQPVPSGCGFGLFPISPVIQRPVISAMQIMKITKTTNNKFSRYKQFGTEMGDVLQ